MHKTIYIDVDEEIIGIINKIRRETTREIFLVVPKNSLLTQGIINLKLLKKEVAKMGKKIILVTSDQHSKRIIKRVGLETKTKSVQDFVSNEDLDLKNQEEPETKKTQDQISTQKPEKREIGSSNFYNSNLKDSNKEKPFEAIEQHFPSSTLESKKIKVITPNTFGDEHLQNYNLKKEIDSKEKIKKEEPKFRPNLNFDKKSNFSSRNTIDDFYQESILDKKDSYLEKKPKKKVKFKSPNSKKIKIFSVFVSFLLLLFLGYWSLSNWPKMKIELFLKEEVLDTKLDLTICEEKLNSGDCLNGEYQELTLTISDQYDSSGEEFSNDKGMARGIVKIYNNYSTIKQPLVATTRVLSKEGKLFRLVKNVTVPGVIDDKPGVIEAQVIASEIGQNYNIEASEFTIEGFKGSEKYEKFKVVSENSMTGGANDIENKKVKIVTEQDINSAREKTIELFNKNLEENIKKELGENETFVLSSIEKEIIGSDSSYAPGDIINKFSYTIREKIKLFTFSNNEFEKIIKDSFEDENLESLEFEKISKINFEKDVVNNESKKLELSIAANAIYWPIIDEIKLKKELSNKNNDELKAFLTSLSKIKKAVIFYSPSWLSIFPVKNKNITIEMTQ